MSYRRTLPKLAKSELVKVIKRTRQETYNAELLAENLQMQATILQLKPKIPEGRFPSLFQVLYIAALVHGIALMVILAKGGFFNR